MGKEITRWREDIFNILNMIRKRKFKGYTGIAIKNSFYQFMTTVITNLSSLVLLVILARILMPELFGLYSLALTTILLFVTLSNLGVGQSLVRFISRELGKRKKAKAKAYSIYFLKIKLVLMIGSGVILFILSRFIAETYFNKPIFLALLVGPLYILFAGLVGFIQLYFQAANNFKIPFFVNLFSQALKLILVPILIIYSLKMFSSTEVQLLSITGSLIIMWILTLMFFIFIGRKKLSYLYVKPEKLSSGEKKTLKKFILRMSALIFSGLFFGYIDIFLLGHFVLADFIGYYRVAFSLIEVAGPLLILTTVLFPIFSRLKGRKLERVFKKALRIMFPFSVLLFAFILIFAPLIIRIIYGVEYSNSASILRLLSPLIISLPLVYLYSTYFISQAKIQIVTKLLVISTIMNVLLNYFLIVWLINYSQLAAVYGVSAATIISRYFYLFGLMYYKRKIK